MKIHLKPFRLAMYNKYLLNFDNLDQSLNVEKQLKRKQYIHWSVQNTKIVSPATNLLAEILTQQRLLVKKSNFYNINDLLINVSKKKLPIILDIYFNANFINKWQVINLSYEKLLKRIHFFTNDQVSNKLNFLLYSNYKIYINLKKHF